MNTTQERMSRKQRRHAAKPIERPQPDAAYPIVEVKSPSTAHMDTSAKLIGYFKLPSVCHYLFVDPDARKVTHHRRTASGAVAADTLTSGIIRLDPPGLTVEAADLFG